MGEDRSGELTRTLGELFEGLRDSRLEALGELDQIQTMSRVLLQYEARRIDERFGEDHPRSRSVKASLEQNLDNIRGIELELEITGIEVAEAEENQTLIHGRVVDERSHGVGGLFVTISDEGGRTLTPFGRAETDAAGYYALVVDPDALARVSEVAREGVFLTVRTRRGEIVHQEFDPLTIAEGDRKTAEVVLRREDLIGGTRRTTEYRRETGYEASEEPELEDVWGIGPKRADLLRRAGITSVRALSEAEDERLKDILGNVDVQKLKQDSAAVLEGTRG